MAAVELRFLADESCDFAVVRALFQVMPALNCPLTWFGWSPRKV